LSAQIGTNDRPGGARLALTAWTVRYLPTPRMIAVDKHLPTAGDFLAVEDFVRQ
jgi:hypothetical protein